MKTIDIDKVKNETYEERKEFEGNRDSMEEQYHVNLTKSFKNLSNYFIFQKIYFIFNKY